MKIVAKTRVRLLLGIILISTVAYLYLLSFIVWGLYIPTFDVFSNTHGFDVIPWFLYPLRFGVTGLLALSFILSYIFKRFEREVFVFGIIAIVAFLTGAFYSELRFGKYIMASMVGLASILLYKILSTQKRTLPRPLINGLLIGLVDTSSSFSILMYLAYVEIGANVIRNRTSDRADAHAYIVSN